MNADNQTNEDGLDCGTLDENSLSLWANYEYWCEGVFMVAIGGIGLVGNIGSIAVLATKEMRSHSFNNLLLALSIFDLLYIIIGVPVYAVPVFKLETWIYSVLYPTFFYPFTSIFFNGSIFMVMSLTIERYIAVCHPFRYHDMNVSISNKVRVMIYTLPSIVVSTLLSIPKFLEAKITYENSTGIAYDVTELRRDPTYLKYYTFSYIAHPILSTVVIPTLVLIILNVKVCWALQRSNSGVNQSHSKSERNLAVVLLTICLVFVICHLLRIILAFVAVSDVYNTILCLHKGNSWVPADWVMCLESVSHLLVMLPSSTNFIIYCFISTQFKLFFKKMFGFSDS